MELPLRLPSWMQSIGSKLDLSFVLDLLNLDDHEFVGKSLLASLDDKTAHQVRLAAQIKDLVLDNLIIT